MSAQDLKSIFKQAAETVKDLPEHLQATAFNRAVDLLVGGTPQAIPGPGGSAGRNTPKPSPRRTAAASGASSNPERDPVALLMDLDLEKAPDVDRQRTALGRSLALLLVARRECGIDGLSAPQIAAVLTDRFRHRVTRQAVGQALDAAGRVVDRKPGPGRQAATFRLMRAGEEWLEQPEDGADDTPKTSRPLGRSRTPARPKKAAATRGPDATLPQPLAGKRSRPASRPGPKGALEALIQRGFFASPRDIAAIRKDLEDNQALRFSAQDLSPALTRLLREGKLERTKGNGRYTYTVRA